MNAQLKRFEIRGIVSANGLRGIVQNVAVGVIGCRLIEHLGLVCFKIWQKGRVS